MAQFTGRVEAQIVSGGKGHSAVSKAAYNARCVLENERLGTRDNYSTKSAECLFSGIYAPRDAPEWTRDRSQLWNHVEAFELGKRKDAQLAREFQIALPHELTPEQNRYALQDFIRENFTRKGLIADLAIHAPDRHGDERNVHAHLMVVLRKLDGTEFAAKKDRLTQPERAAELEGWKRSLEHHLNRHLERHGFDPYYDLRSLAERGIAAEPTIHMGKDASALERQGVDTEPGRINRNIEERNRLQAELARLLADQERQAANDIGRAAGLNPAQGTAREAVPLRQAHPEHATAERPTQLRSPEDMRRDYASSLRSDPTLDRQPESAPTYTTREAWAALLREQNPRPDRPAEHPEIERANVNQAVKEPPLDREAWAALLREQNPRPEAAREPPPSRKREWDRQPEKPSERAQIDASSQTYRNPLRLDPEPKASKRNPLRFDPDHDRAPVRRSPADVLLDQARAELAAERARESPEERRSREEREASGGRGRDRTRYRRKPLDFNKKAKPYRRGSAHRVDC